jgi:hypothetical protein
MNGVSSAKRVEPADGESGGFAAGEAAREAVRCMHCECLKPAGCLLRSMAAEVRGLAKEVQPRREEIGQEDNRPRHCCV